MGKIFETKKIQPSNGELSKDKLSESSTTITNSPEYWIEEDTSTICIEDFDVNLMHLEKKCSLYKFSSSNKSQARPPPFRDDVRPQRTQCDGECLDCLHEPGQFEQFKDAFASCRKSKAAPDAETEWNNLRKSYELRWTWDNDCWKSDTVLGFRVDLGADSIAGASTVDCYTECDLIPDNIGSTCTNSPRRTLILDSVLDSVIGKRKRDSDGGSGIKRQKTASLLNISALDNQTCVNDDYLFRK